MNLWNWLRLLFRSTIRLTTYKYPSFSGKVCFLLLTAYIYTCKDTSIRSCFHSIVKSLYILSYFCLQSQVPMRESGCLLWWWSSQFLSAKLSVLLYVLWGCVAVRYVRFMTVISFYIITQYFLLLRMFFVLLHFICLKNDYSCSVFVPFLYFWLFWVVYISVPLVVRAISLD